MNESTDSNSIKPDVLLEQVGLPLFVFDSIGDAVSIQDRQFRILYQNDAHRKLFGDHRGEHCFRTLQQRGEICGGCPVALVYDDGMSHTAVLEGITQAGTVFAEISASPIRDRSGQIVAGIEIARDVTARKQTEIELSLCRTKLEDAAQRLTEELMTLKQQFLADLEARKKVEQALKESESFVSNIFDSVGEGLTVISRDYTILSANRSFLNLSGRHLEDAVGRHCFEISHGIDTPCFLAGEYCPTKLTFETGNPHQSVHMHKDSDGNTTYVEIRAYPMKDARGEVVSVIEAVNDITLQRKLEEQLRNSQKLEAVGQLAGGIAHDFNNILTAITGYGNLLQIKLEESSPLRKNADHIVAAADKAANLIQGLLTYSRKQIINPRRISLNELIQKIERLLMRLIGEDIELRIVLSGENPLVNVDPGQIDQVMMNLTTNARDAMPEGGVLGIRTELVTFTEDQIKSRALGAPGKYAALSFTDSGMGMDEKIRTKIFDPFFTTKEVGKGTGLGLAMVYGIIKQHEGFIDVSSSVGHGTTFTIYLPVAETGHAETRAACVPPNVQGGTETILLAEDDNNIRELVREILSKAGYTVLCAVDGQQAIDFFLQHNNEIDLLFLDVIMPRKNGRAVYEEAVAVRPSIKALFMSGHTVALLQKEGKIVPGLNFISKPLSMNQLLIKVRETLDSR